MLNNYIFKAKTHFLYCTVYENKPEILEPGTKHTWGDVDVQFRETSLTAAYT